MIFPLSYGLTGICQQKMDRFFNLSILLFIVPALDRQRLFGFFYLRNSSSEYMSEALLKHSGRV